ncbi:MAG: prolyl oligopeptidase family serine peptidase [Bacteroidales bacterium]|nr:prolyl oligopeptidase family serine peptidase [Bacteroidales bacterium]
MSTWAQKEAVWDNPADGQWNSAIKHVQIISSADGAMQDAMFYKSTKKTPQPLIVSLHTWSGNYLQGDPLAKEVLLRNWNYIHPDFRGPNFNPDACGSSLVLSDILDAIHYAVKNGNVDTTQVHIVGVSGGAYLTLLCYMRLKYPVKSFNAWAPISDLYRWYWQSRGRHDIYAKELTDIAQVNGKTDLNELKKRSPMYYPVPVEERKNSYLNIYEGVHDGYKGSVPISQTFRFYNKVAKALYPNNKSGIVPKNLWMKILIDQCNPKADSSKLIGGRLIQLEKHLPKLSLTIFEGGHEMIVPVGLTLVPAGQVKNLAPLNILTIGDSNGAFKFGWPKQLMKLLPYSTIINKSIPGNTIGFDNLERPELNTLRNIDKYLAETYNKLPNGQQLDYIFIGLGSNDTKAVFKNEQKEVPKKMAKLLVDIKSWLKINHKQMPQICIITPPPTDKHKYYVPKYGGSNARIQKNNIKFKKVAEKSHVGFINTYSILDNSISTGTIDGIHLKPQLQFEEAKILVDYINHHKAK